MQRLLYIIRTLIRQDAVVFIFLIGIYLYFSYLPVAINYRNTPGIRYYFGGEPYPLDMIGNLAHVREGYNGHWQKFSKFTSTIESPPSLLKMEYTTIGQLARLFHQDTLDMYVYTRFIISLLTFAAIFIIVRATFKRPLERILAYVFILFATVVTLPAQSAADPLLVVNRILFDSFVFTRLTQIAHHYILGGTLSLLSVYFLARVLDVPHKKRYFVVACLTGFLTSFLFAPDSVTTLSGFPVAFLILAYRFWKKRHTIRHLIPLAVIFGTYCVILMLPIVYVKLVIMHLWDWNVYSFTEHIVPFTLSLPEYLLALGLPYLLSIVAIPTIVKRGSTFLVLLLPWVIMHPIGFFFLTPLLDINKVRYFLSLYFIVFGILGTVGAIAIGKSLVTITKKSVFLPLTLVSCIVILLFLNGKSYPLLFEKQLTCFCLAEEYTFGYPKKEIMNAVWWLRDNTKEHDIVLSSAYTGALIAPFAGNDVVMNWWFRISAPDLFFPLKAEVDGFYNGTVSWDWARDFLKNNRVRYVVYSYMERAWDKPMELPYSFLQSVYSSERTRIYKVTNL